MASKVYLWKNGKPVEEDVKVTFEIIDKETGEIRIKGADLAVAMNHVILIPEYVEEPVNKDVETEESTVTVPEVPDVGV